MKAKRDPNGWTPAQALKAWRASGLHIGEGTLAATAYPCHGQPMFAGAKTTRGCMHAHLQPCPGGPMVYRLSRCYVGPMGLAFNVIESEADSWQDAITKLVTRRDKENARYAKLREETQKPKRRRAR